MAIRETLEREVKLRAAEKRLCSLAEKQPAGAIGGGRLIERERKCVARGRAEWGSAWKRLAKAA